MKDFWYPAAPSGQLQDRPMAAQVFDDRLVLFRAIDGTPRALADRCCHRGYPLSNGNVIEGKIACGFHGWQFDGAGKW